MCAGRADIEVLLHPSGDEYDFHRGLAGLWLCRADHGWSLFAEAEPAADGPLRPLASRPLPVAGNIHRGNRCTEQLDEPQDAVEDLQHLQLRLEDDLSTFHQPRRCAPVLDCLTTVYANKLAEAPESVAGPNRHFRDPVGGGLQPLHAVHSRTSMPTERILPVRIDYQIIRARRSLRTGPNRNGSPQRSS